MKKWNSLWIAVIIVSIFAIIGVIQKSCLAGEIPVACEQLNNGSPSCIGNIIKEEKKEIIVEKIERSDEQVVGEFFAKFFKSIMYSKEENALLVKSKEVKENTKMVNSSFDYNKPLQREPDSIIISSYECGTIEECQVLWDKHKSL